MSYYELWAILANWKSEFSANDFASAFSSPDPRKVLSDMTAKGLLERTGRGRYRVTTTSEYVRSKYNIAEAYDVIKNAGLPYALTDVDAVFVWTRGGYNANRFFGSYPVYVKVRKGDLVKWKAYLAAAGKNYAVGTKPRKTLYGIYYFLFPTPRLESEMVGGLSVEPLKTVVEFCRRDPFTYSPALEMLDSIYSLGLNASYAAPLGPR
jgi:hypothetical protein